MMCRYCQQECRPIQKGYRPCGLYENRIAHCDACNVKYFDSFHVLYCTIDGKDFSVSYMDDHPDHWTAIYRDNIVHPSGCISNEIVLQFHQNVKLTPDNFRDKLKLYLLFS